MNNYQAAAAGFGPPASPHGAGGRAGFPAASSPGPALDVYGSAADSVGYVQAASPQPSGFPAIAVSRAPLNYTPVSKSVCYNNALESTTITSATFTRGSFDSKLDRIVSILAVVFVNTFNNQNVIKFE